MATTGWTAAVLMALVVVMTYGHTLDVPFYMDDYPSIVNNPAIVDWRQIDAIWRFAPLRVVGYMSLALNYHWHQFQVHGYHVVNIVIHFLAGAAVFGFAGALMRTPALAEDKPGAIARVWFPIFSALIFLSHPLQTQAVTYTIQRLASLAALFYIATMTCYLYGRLATGSRRTRLGWYGLSIGFALLSFLTKQNTFTLPMAILVLEGVFFPGARTRFALKAAFALTGILAAWGVLGGILGYNPFSLDAMEALTRETTAISRGIYLLTQFKVLWIYLKLFFWPVGLHLDYDIALPAQFFEGIIPFAAAGHVLILAPAVFLRRRFPVPAFAVFFFYLAHSVESGFIPISDVCFEHRMYLPSFGLCLAVAWGVVHSGRLIGKNWIPGALFFFLLMIAGTLTWHRNELWRAPVLFWRDCVRHTPDKERTWNELVHQLLQAGRNAEAAEVMFQSVRKKNTHSLGRAKLQEPTIINFITVLQRMGRYDEALRMADNALEMELHPKSRFKILNNKGNIYFEGKKYEPAEICYREAMAAFPDNPQVHSILYNLALTQFNLGKYPAAINSVKAMLDHPLPTEDKALALCLQASLYSKIGAYAEAEKNYRRVLLIQPENREALDALRELGKS
ncbi:MAG: tetratricopeptide repeat protein [Pseudomonadota bacterium]